MKTKEKLHRWNVVGVTTFGFPHSYCEFHVESKNILGAIMRGNNMLKIKNTEDENKKWKIKSVYWLDPFCYREEKE